MAQIPVPELYLSLLSGGETHISPEPHDNDIGSRISAHQFPNGPNGSIRDLLDALASICVRKEKGEDFFVSLAMGLDSATLYVACNDKIPLSLATYLYKIRAQLKELSTILEFHSPTVADSESSPNPNTSQSQTLELELKKTIYKHTYSKLRQRFLKRAPAILAKYPSIKTSFRVDWIAADDTDLLDDTIALLGWLGSSCKEKVRQLTNSSTSFGRLTR